ncbi:hypothetical protein K470DRAFT_272775 [Piedraia hortae CBS 480.64]|uniref:Uncharacterized protein n=1 Tax=Piedraia hortae CBS 480.64 TaxID=1314780 RepID=A0A6A7BTI6_9PEZI|nr:hypothetical protein K470DRAFT_272775 [Piedraia hortae CBS 480.64]
MASGQDPSNAYVSSSAPLAMTPLDPPDPKHSDELKLALNGTLSMVPSGCVEWALKSVRGELPSEKRCPLVLEARCGLQEPRDDSVYHHVMGNVETAAQQVMPSIESPTPSSSSSNEWSAPPSPTPASFGSSMPRSYRPCGMLPDQSPTTPPTGNPSAGSPESPSGSSFGSPSTGLLRPGQSSALPTPSPPAEASAQPYQASRDVPSNYPSPLRSPSRDETPSDDDAGQEVKTAAILKLEEAARRPTGPACSVTAKYTLAPVAWPGWKADPAKTVNYKNNERVATWDTDMRDAPPLTVALPPIDIGIREAACYLPAHLSNLPELNLRARAHNFGPRLIAQMALYHRDRIAEPSVKRVHDKIRKQHRPNFTYYHGPEKDFRKNKVKQALADPKLFAAKGLSPYHVGHMLARPADHKKLALYPLAAMAQGVVIPPQGQDRGILTQVIEWCVQNDQFATVQDLPRIVTEQGFQLPQEALDPQINWDDMALIRAEAEVGHLCPGDSKNKQSSTQTKTESSAQNSTGGKTGGKKRKASAQSTSRAKKQIGAQQEVPQQQVYNPNLQPQQQLMYPPPHTQYLHPQNVHPLQQQVYRPALQQGQFQPQHIENDENLPPQQHLQYQQQIRQTQHVQSHYQQPPQEMLRQAYQPQQQNIPQHGSYQHYVSPQVYHQHTTRQPQQLQRQPQQAAQHEEQQCQRQQYRQTMQQQAQTGMYQQQPQAQAKQSVQRQQPQHSTQQQQNMHQPRPQSRQQAVQQQAQTGVNQQQPQGPAHQAVQHQQQPVPAQRGTYQYQQNMHQSQQLQQQKTAQTHQLPQKPVVQHQQQPPQATRSQFRSATYHQQQHQTQPGMYIHPRSIAANPAYQSQRAQQAVYHPQNVHEQRQQATPQDQSAQRAGYQRQDQRAYNPQTLQYEQQSRQGDPQRVSTPQDIQRQQDQRVYQAQRDQHSHGGASQHDHLFPPGERRAERR